MADEEGVDLGRFEGLPVLKVGVEIPSAAGGLRDPLRVDPIVLHGGETAFATFELLTEKIRHDPVKVDDVLIGWTRVHVMSVTVATFIDENLVRDQLDEMARRVAARKEAEKLAKERDKGVQRIGNPDQLTADHGEGKHASGLVEGCPECDWEDEATEEERAEAADAPA